MSSASHVRQPAETNIYTPHQRFAVLIVTLVLLGALAVFGLLQYLAVFLGAGILYVACSAERC